MVEQELMNNIMARQTAIALYLKILVQHLTLNLKSLIVKNTGKHG
jgi:hypothetical protein